MCLVLSKPWLLRCLKKYYKCNYSSLELGNPESVWISHCYYSNRNNSELSTTKDE